MFDGEAGNGSLSNSHRCSFSAPQIDFRSFNTLYPTPAQSSSDDRSCSFKNVDRPGIHFFFFPQVYPLGEMGSL